ncbi:MAG: pyruvate carboxylase subunit B [Candidatus Dormibacteria bacterium]
MPTPLRIADVTLRDGQQTLLGSLLSGDDLVRVAAALDGVGLAAIEAWGGGVFAGAVSQLHEDPWELLGRLREATPRTPLQVMLRGQNLVGDRNFADDAAELFVKRAVVRGAQVFRVFDPLNDLRNMDRVIASAREAGAQVHGGVCYTLSPVHSTRALAEFAGRLVEAGCHGVWIKDTAGLLTPGTVTDLVRAIRRVGTFPLALHSHSTRGLGGMVHMAAAIAGADTVDACLSPLSGGASHPPTEALIVAAAGTPRDTGIDPGMLDHAREELEQVLARRGLEPDPHLSRLDSALFRYGVPGTMMTELRRQMDLQEVDPHRLDAVLVEVERVRAELGYPPLMMPVSRLIAEQAVLNVSAPKRYGTIAHDVRDYVQGLYGTPPAPVDEAVRELAIGRNQPISMRPADLLKPELPEARKRLRAENVSRDDDEALLTAVVLGAQALPFLRGERAPVSTGPEAEERELAEEQVAERTAAIGAEFAAGQSPAPDGATPPESGRQMRMFEVEVDGERYQVKVTGEGLGAAGPPPAAGGSPDALPAGQHAITAPMQGLLLKVRVAEGDRVALGDVVAVLEAMKMQNDIAATVAGTVRRIHVQEGTVVSPNQVLMAIQ